MAVAPLHSVTLDCPDPGLLAEFYRLLAGGVIVYSSTDFVFLASTPIGLGFQRAERSASAEDWPQPRQAGPLRVHLDFAVEHSAQLDELEAQALALGARRPATQARPDAWRVLLDPAGHPFCLTSVTG